MRVIALYGAVTEYDLGLASVMKIIYNTFRELGVETEEINIAGLGINYFTGAKDSAVESVIKKIKDSSGVIFASVASMNAPCAVTQTFIEHLGGGLYGKVLEGKKCFAVTVSKDGSENEASFYLLKTVCALGGIETGKMTVGAPYLSNIGSEEANEIVAKYVEDYYRILRQDRKFFIPQLKKAVNSSPESAEIENLKREATELLGKTPKPKKIKSHELLEQVDFQEFNERQKRDIDEITKMLSSQYNKSTAKNFGKEDNLEGSYTNSFFESANVVPHIKTCRQKTQSLFHYFQPQLAGGIEAVIQLNIKGDEKFECYLEIKDAECSFKEGVSENADVTVFADSKVWNDILDGKYTTQKAFMIGQLKVRGNFVLLTKFDQIFKIK